MASSFNERAFAAKLAAVDASAPSIQRTGRYILLQAAHAPLMAAPMLRELDARGAAADAPMRRLELLYLLNDVLQNAIRKGARAPAPGAPGALAAAFAEPLLRARSSRRQLRKLRQI